MAIIKCPECGRQISDKAPTCPSCGVEIAGKTTKCPNCGEVYFNYLEMCPNCQTPNPTLVVAGRDHSYSFCTGTVNRPGSSSTTVCKTNHAADRKHRECLLLLHLHPYRPTTNNGNGGEQNPEKKEPEKKMSVRSILIISLIFSVLVCGILYYFL